MKPVKTGWQQSAAYGGCLHLGLLGAVFTIGTHDIGHEWLCDCGKVFVVARGPEGRKTMEPRP